MKESLQFSRYVLGGGSNNDATHTILPQLLPGDVLIKPAFRLKDRDSRVCIYLGARCYIYAVPLIIIWCSCVIN